MTKQDKAGKILGIFERFLNEKGIEIKNEQRDWAEKDDPFETYAILFGDDYYGLEDQVMEVLGR